MSELSPSVTRRASRRPLVALAVVAALLAAVFVPVAANAAVPKVTGTLSNASGVKLAGVTVSLVDVSSQLTKATTVTSSTGAFSFIGMADDEYTLYFDKSSSTYPQYLGGETKLNYGITFATNGVSNVELNAVARLAGTIQGTITNAVPAAVVGFTVRAYQVDARGDWNAVATTTTNSAGTYYLRGLVPGAYRLEALDLAHAVPTYAPLYSGSNVSLVAGTDIGVLGGAIAAYNFRVGTSGKVSGVVTGDSAVKLAGVKVNVHQLVGTPGAFSESVSLATPSVTTGATGAYTISGLAPGYYTLEFVPAIPADPLDLGYGREFLGNVPQAIDATFLTIANGTVLTGKNIQLTQGAAVHGSVLIGEDLPTQNPIDGILVTVDHATADPAHPSKDAQSMLTDSSGGSDLSYHFKGLGAGDWVLIVGSLTTGDTSRGRTVIPLSGGPLVAGQDRLERVSVSLVDPAGMHAMSGLEPYITQISGYVVGSSLAANPGVWSGAVDWADFTYQWNRGGRAIPGATSQSYQITGGDWTSVLSVTVSVCNFAIGCGSYTTAGTPAIDIGTNQADNPQASLSGTLQVGKTVTAFPGEWLVGGGSFIYGWQTSPDNSTWTYTGDGGATHVITATDLTNGPYLRAHITGKRVGYTDYTTDATGLQPIIPGTFTQLTAPAVSATSANFVVTKGTYTPVGGTVTATWTVHETDGSTTTSSGFTLPRAGLAGKYVSVQVTLSMAGFTDFTTAVKTVQVGTHPLPVESNLVTGTPQVSATLSAPTFTWTPAPTTLKWQWQYFNGTAWANIAGATSSTYVVQASVLNRNLRVVTAESTFGYNAVTLVSPQTAKVIAGVALVNSTPASLNDVTPATNEVITVDPGVWTPTATVSYQWKRIPVGGASYSVIAGATSASYKVPVSLIGSTLAVDVKATRAGHPTTLITLVSGVVGQGYLTMLTSPTSTRVGTSTVYTLTEGTWSSTPDHVSTYWTIYLFDSDDLNPSNFGSVSTGLSTGQYDTAASALNTHVAYTVTVRVPGYADTTSPLMLLKKGTPVLSSGPIVDDGNVGIPMTVTMGGYNVTGVATTYQWQYLAGATWTNIAGATSNTFTPSGAYLNKQVRITLVASRANYNTVTIYSPQALVSQGSAASPGVGGLAPSISGSLAIGSTLTALPGTWTLPGVTYSYQWFAAPSGGSADPIVGATNASYKVPESLLGFDLRVLITAKKLGHSDGSTFVYASASIGTGTLVKTVSPVVSKSLTGVYSISSGAWNAAPTAYSYEWKRFDPTTDTATTVAGPSSSAKSYKPTLADGTNLITVTVTASRANYANGVATIVARSGIKLAATTTPFVFGTNVVGNQFNAIAPDWNSPSPTLSYKWYRDGIQIPGAAASTYTQVVADIAHVVSVTVTASKTGYGSMSYNLKNAKTLSAVPITATTKPSIVGTQEVDSVLTANVGVWSQAGLTYTYQWTLSGFPIPGATAATHKVTLEDVNNEVAVVVTAHKVNYVNGVATSASVTAQYSSALSANAPTIAAVAVNAVQLKVTNVVTWTLKATTQYQWQVRLSGSGSWDDIPSGNASTFTPNGYASGDSFRLIITGNSAGQYTFSVVSNISTIA